MSEFEEFDVNTETLIPVTRLVAGDKVQLKGYGPLFACDCSPCESAQELATAGAVFEVGGVLTEAEYVFETTGVEIPSDSNPDHAILVTSEWAAPLSIWARVPVREFWEESIQRLAE